MLSFSLVPSVPWSRLRFPRLVRDGNRRHVGTDALHLRVDHFVAMVRGVTGRVMPVAGSVRMSLLPAI